MKKTGDSNEGIDSNIIPGDNGNRHRSKSSPVFVAAYNNRNKHFRHTLPLPEEVQSVAEHESNDSLSAAKTLEIIRTEKAKQDAELVNALPSAKAIEHERNKLREVTSDTENLIKEKLQFNNNKKKPARNSCFCFRSRHY